MSNLLLTWISLISGILTVIFLITFLVTGRKNATLRVSAGVLCIVAVVSNFIARM